MSYFPSTYILSINYNIALSVIQLTSLDVADTYRFSTGFIFCPNDCDDDDASMQPDTPKTLSKHEQLKSHYVSIDLSILQTTTLLMNREQSPCHCDYHDIVAIGRESIGSQQLISAIDALSGGATA